MSEGKPSSSLPRAPKASEEPTASARLIISLRPFKFTADTRGIPPRHVSTLIAAFSQITVVALLGVVAPALTVVAVKIPAVWTVGLIVVELAASITALLVLRRR